MYGNDLLGVAKGREGVVEKNDADIHSAVPNIEFFNIARNKKVDTRVNVDLFLSS